MNCHYGIRAFGRLPPLPLHTEMAVFSLSAPACALHADRCGHAQAGLSAPNHHSFVIKCGKATKGLIFTPFFVILYTLSS